MKYNDVTSSVRQLTVNSLTVDAFDESIAAHRRIVSDVSFELSAGQGLGITGESGSGKTTLSLALSGLLSPATHVSVDKLVLQLVEHSSAGPIHFDLAAAGRLDEWLPRLHGPHVFTLFQEPRASLNPHRTIGWQLNRCLRRVASSSPDSTRSRDHSPDTALAEVGLDQDVARHYPHELSTGMCQRVFLAMASLLGSSILIADEPFASVDAESQTRLIRLVREWLTTRAITLVLVSHDLSLLRELTDQMLVMYRGQVAESGPTAAVLDRGRMVHPYTWLLSHVSESGGPGGGFLSGVGRRRPARCCFAPRCAWAESAICIEDVPELRKTSSQNVSPDASSRDRMLRCVRYPIVDRCETGRLEESGICRDEAVSGDERELLLRVRELVRVFTTGWIRRKNRRVLDGVTFTVSEGERLGIMGPNGQGKTTLARVILGVLQPTRGTVEFRDGVDWKSVSRMQTEHPVRFRRRVQLVYQDADLVLDPAATIGDALVEAYRVFNPRIRRADAYRLAALLLNELALPESMLEAYPYRLSGGERKRVVLARCLAALGCPYAARSDEPWRLVILDEPTAGVDVFLQAMLARFLIWVQPRLRLSYLVISHEEAFVRRFCHRTLRLERGRLLTEVSHASVAQT